MENAAYLVLHVLVFCSYDEISEITYKEGLFHLSVQRGQSMVAWPYSKTEHDGGSTWQSNLFTSWWLGSREKERAHWQGHTPVMLLHPIMLHLLEVLPPPNSPSAEDHAS